MTIDIIKIIHESLIGIDRDFDAEHERRHLRELLDHVSTIITHLHALHPNGQMQLAAKQIEYNIVHEKTKQKERIRPPEEQHKKELAIQQSELECLQAEKDAEAAKARLEVCNREIMQLGDDQSLKTKQVNPNPASKSVAPPPFVAWRNALAFLNWCKLFCTVWQ